MSHFATPDYWYLYRHLPTIILPSCDRIHGILLCISRKSVNSGPHEQDSITALSE
jgi:hypothetical protein